MFAPSSHYLPCIPTSYLPYHKPLSSISNLSQPLTAESTYSSMSFSAVASYPSDKGTDFYGQGFEDLDSNFFEQFLTFSSPAYSEGHEYSAIPQPEYLEKSITDSHDTLSSLDDDTKTTGDQNSWQGEGDLWATGAASASASFGPNHSQANGFYSELSRRAAISDSELLSLEGITLDSPHIRAHSQLSLPSSPSPAVVAATRRKTRLVESLSKTFKKATGSIEKSLRSPIRKPNTSPKMGRVSNHSQTSIDQWGHKLQVDALKFKFDFEENTVSLLSTPLSTNVAEQPETLDEILEIKTERPNGFIYNTQQIDLTAEFDTPLTTPVLVSDHSRKTSGEEIGYPITPQLQNNSAVWSQAPSSSERNTYGSRSIYPPADMDTPVWWNHASTAPMAQPLPTGFHTNPQMATKSLAHQLQNDLAFENNDVACSPSIMASGLMIQMPGYNSQQSFVMGSSPPIKQRGFSNSQPHNSQLQRHHARRPYNKASPRQPSQSSPVRKNRSSESSGSESPSPKSSSTGFHVRKRKSPKTSKHSTPRTPPGLGGAVDFVNYTPNDSRKILTGVAPSGSSKTKARREKEAMDKRRKLSQAALRAVKAAGGDVESLVEQGLFT